MRLCILLWSNLSWNMSDAHIVYGVPPSIWNISFVWNATICCGALIPLMGMCVRAPQHVSVATIWLSAHLKHKSLGGIHWQGGVWWEWVSHNDCGPGKKPNLKRLFKRDGGLSRYMPQEHGFGDPFSSRRSYHCYPGDLRTVGQLPR